MSRVSEIAVHASVIPGKPARSESREDSGFSALIEAEVPSTDTGDQPARPMVGEANPDGSGARGQAAVSAAAKLINIPAAIEAAIAADIAAPAGADTASDNLAAIASPSVVPSPLIVVDAAIADKSAEDGSSDTPDAAVSDAEQDKLTALAATGLNAVAALVQTNISPSVEVRPASAGPDAALAQPVTAPSPVSTGEIFTADKASANDAIGVPPPAKPVAAATLQSDAASADASSSADMGLPAQFDPQIKAASENAIARKAASGAGAASSLPDAATKTGLPESAPQPQFAGDAASLGPFEGPDANGKAADGLPKDASSVPASEATRKEFKPDEIAPVQARAGAPDVKAAAAPAVAVQQQGPSSTDVPAPVTVATHPVQTVTPVQAQLTAIPAAPGAAVPLDGLAVEISARAKSGKSRFEIRLDPPELGRIDVRLDIDRHGKVASHMIVEKAETLDLLRRDAPQLERALADSGLKTSDSGLQFSLRDQSFAGRGDQNDNRQSARLIIAEDDTVPAAVAGRSYRMAGAAGGLDIRV